MSNNKKSYYTYFSTLRPTGPGTCPRDGLVDFENFDERRMVRGVYCWGRVRFNRPLTEDEQKGYDLQRDWGI